MKAFKNGAEFERWLAKNHEREAELLIRLFKTSAASKGMGYKEALDAVLIWGWIDGVRRYVDDDSFSIRFSPRKAKSNWSAVNIRRIGELEALGRMQEPGRAAFAKREEKRSTVYSYENKPKALAAPYEKRFRSNKKAWAYFSERPPWYQRTSYYWVMSAKKEETQLRRLEDLIACSARETTIGPLTATKNHTPRSTAKPRARSSAKPAKAAARGARKSRS